MRHLRPGRHVGTILAMAAFAAFGSSGFGAEGLAATKPAQPFILGADISWLPEDEASGAQYFEGGVRRDLFDILRGHGFNWVRLRVFVEPKNGYARRRDEAFCDIEHTVAMARRARAAGMRVLVDLHYSDTWADPEHQEKPAAWRGLTMPELASAVHDHTFAVVSALKRAGVAADMVAIGNETTHGMLWPDGRVWSQIPSGNAQTDARTRELGPGTGNYDNFAVLLRAGIRGARDADPAVPIMLHNHLGRHAARVGEWLDALVARGVEFDVLGLSCYAQGVEGDWQRTFADVAAKYPTLKIAVAEYSARKRYVNDLVRAIPDGRGIGTFIWEPTRHREALFDRDGVNAGGGQASNFVGDVGIDQGATATRSATRPTATRPATSRPRRGAGGRYDANAFFELYSEMSRDYATREAHAGPATRPARIDNASGAD